MKKYFLLLANFFISFYLFSQAKLGYSEEQIKSFFPNNEWKSGYNQLGKLYIQTYIDQCWWIYYFDKGSHLSDVCVCVPNDMKTTNYLVEKYNNNYVILSSRSWKAYLEGGGIMYIQLKYEEEYKFYSFTYEGGE